MSTTEKLQHKLSNCLCPPGNGVFTVNTAKERKAELHQAMFGTTENIEALWQDTLAQLPDNNKAVVLGICSDTGGGILRGANWGPLFLRSTLYRNYPGLETLDIGDVRVIPHILHDKYLNDKTISKCRNALYQNTDSEYCVSPLSITEDVLHDFYAAYPEQGVFGIGGDHSISYPLTKAYLVAKKQLGKRAAIIHFDAHTDLLVERLGIDLCFGSWCTHILGDLNSPSHLVQLGIRSSGKPKAHWEQTFGVQQHWAQEILDNGAEQTVAGIIEYLKAEQIDELYVSFDIDAIDSSYASATGTPEPGGIFPEDAMVILRALAKEFPITGADMMEISPFLNTSNNEPQGAEKTLAVGAEISAFLIEQINK